ncbi:hypothetical protein HDV00_005960 [Rhizophlyctis rosea]|nr:hypothetical protein HDV00_005960 [Rhizophlyctis rosea]
MSSRTTRRSNEKDTTYMDKNDLFKQSILLVQQPQPDQTSSEPGVAATGHSTIQAIAPNSFVLLPFTFAPQSSTLPFCSSDELKFSPNNTQYVMKYTLGASARIPRKHVFNENVSAELNVPVRVPSPYLAIIAQTPPAPAGWINSMPYNLTPTVTKTPHTPYLLHFTLEHGTVLHPQRPFPIRFRITPAANIQANRILAIQIKVKQYYEIRTGRHKGTHKIVLFLHEIKQSVNGEFWKQRDFTLMMHDNGQIRDTMVGGAAGLLQIWHRLKVRIVTDGFGSGGKFATQVFVAKLA